MKRSEAKTVGQIFEEAMSEAGMSKVFDQQQASYLWPEIVGPTINRCTTRRYVENGVLHVYISSAPLRSELSFLKDELVRHINEAVGSDVINSIIIH